MTPARSAKPYVRGLKGGTVSRNPIFLFALLFVVVGVSACKDDSTGPTAFRVEGTWGAEHIVLTADRSGGTLEYDCAVGTIYQPLIVGSDGQFDLVGTHTRGAGLPHTGDDAHSTVTARANALGPPIGLRPLLLSLNCGGTRSTRLNGRRPRRASFLRDAVDQRAAARRRILSRSEGYVTLPERWRRTL